MSASVDSVPTAREVDGRAAPLILINSPPSEQPLSLALVNLRQQTMGAVDFGSTESGVVVMAIPCLILFLLLHRYYVRGFMSGAIKG